MCTFYCGIKPPQPTSKSPLFRVGGYSVFEKFPPPAAGGFAPHNFVCKDHIPPIIYERKPTNIFFVHKYIGESKKNCHNIEFGWGKWLGGSGGEAPREKNCNLKHWKEILLNENIISDIWLSSRPTLSRGGLFQFSRFFQKPPYLGGGLFYKGGFIP